MPAPGTRVFALRDCDPNTCTAYAYGLGTYLGRRLIPAGTRTPFGVLAEGEGYENPCIELDEGRGVVWGCQCWWGPVDAMQAQIEGYAVELVDMAELGNPALVRQDEEPGS